MSALEDLSANGDVAGVHLLSKGRRDIPGIDAGNPTALTLAAQHGHLHVVEALISYGANPNIRDNNGETALTQACRRGHTHVVDTLRSRCSLDRDNIRLVRIRLNFRPCHQITLSELLCTVLRLNALTRRAPPNHPMCYVLCLRWYLIGSCGIMKGYNRSHVAWPHKCV